VALHPLFYADGIVRSVKSVTRDGKPAKAVMATVTWRHNHGLRAPQTFLNDMGNGGTGQLA
jgi:hypothetical protein